MTIPIHCGPLNMTDSIVILEVTWVHPEKLPQPVTYIVIQNSAISVGVKLTMNWDKGSHIISEKIIPHHNSPSTELNSSQNAICQEAFSRQMADTNATIRKVNFDSTFQRTCFYCCTIPYRRVLHHITQAAWLVFKDLWVDARP